MAVVIKNIDMPESCKDCPFNWPFKPEKMDGITYCQLTGLDTTDLFLLRHDMCPLENQ